MSPVETVDVVVIGTGFGGAIPGYYLAAAGAKVVFLERGPWLRTEDFTHDLQLGTYTRIVDYIQGDGCDVVAGNCVGGSSVIYFAASLRAPSYVFERTGSTDRRLWPAALTRQTLDPWYERVESTIPISEQRWDDVTYAGGIWGALCDRAGHTCNPVPVAVDLPACTNCNWMLNGCRFGAKRSMLLNYLPAAVDAGAEIRPLHQVEQLRPALGSGHRYAVDFTLIDEDDYRVTVGGGTIEAKVVVLAAGAMGTPVILQRSAPWLGGIPAAVGRHFSPNGDRVTTAVLDETRVRSVLGLNRSATVAYEGHAEGRPISAMTYDFMDASLPEFDRFGLQQIYFPPIVNIVPDDGTPDDPSWFGLDKRDMTSRWRSWLSILAMTEDDNEGTFGPPPLTGNFIRIASSASLGQLTYLANPRTRHGFDRADDAARTIVEHDGVGRLHLWTAGSPVFSAHPLSSCRVGDDPTLSACDDRHELRGHPGIFVTDGAAVPTALTVNPSLTIAAMAERAAQLLLDRGEDYGLALQSGVPPPDTASSPTPPAEPAPRTAPSRASPDAPPLTPATGGGAALAGMAAIAAAAWLRRAGRSDE